MCNCIYKTFRNLGRDLAVIKFKFLDVLWQSSLHHRLYCLKRVFVEAVLLVDNGLYVFQLV